MSPGTQHSGLRICRHLTRHTRPRRPVCSTSPRRDPSTTYGVLAHGSRGAGKLDRSNSLSAQKHGETRLGAFLLSQTIARAAPFSLPAEDSASSQLNTPRAHTRTGTPLRVERYRCASARAPSRRHGRELGRVRGVSFASWNPAIGTEAVSVGQRLP